MENQQPLIDFLPVDADAIPFNDRVLCQLMIDAAHPELAWAAPLFEAVDTVADGSGWEGLVVFYLQQTDPLLLGQTLITSDPEVCTIEVPDEQGLEVLHKHILTLILAPDALSSTLAKLPEAYKSQAH